jgi:glucosyl-dolichyl phosphate glucuronosyltransferase
MSDGGISVVICLGAEDARIDECIDALEHQTIGPDAYEVIIVDGGPRSDLSEFALELSRRNSRVSYLQEQCRGPGVARNAGLRRSSGKIVAFIGIDTVASFDWLERIRECFRILPEDVVGVGGEVVPLFGGERPDWLSDRLLRLIWFGPSWSPVARLLDSGEWLAGRNCAYRRGQLLALGGFPVHLGQAGTPSTWGGSAVDALLERAGLKQYYDPTIRVQCSLSLTRLTRDRFRHRCFWRGVEKNLEQLYTEQTAHRLGFPDPLDSRMLEDIVVPISPQAWADLFDDRSVMPFEQQLRMLEQIGYLLQSQSVVIES